MKNLKSTIAVYEQIDWKGSNRLFRLNAIPSFSDIWTFDSKKQKRNIEIKDFLSPKYFDEINKPLIFWKEKKMNEKQSYQIETEYFFKTCWRDIPTSAVGANQYVLFLPEYAVPEMIKFTDPLKPKNIFFKFVFKDLNLNRFYVLLHLASRYGYFNFDLICKFYKNKETFISARFQRDSKTIDIDYDKGIDCVLEENRFFDDVILKGGLNAEQQEKTKCFINLN